LQLSKPGSATARLAGSPGRSEVEGLPDLVRTVGLPGVSAGLPRAQLGGLEMVTHASLAKVVKAGKPEDSLSLARVRSGQRAPAGEPVSRGRLKELQKP